MLVLHSPNNFCCSSPSDLVWVLPRGSKPGTVDLSICMSLDFAPVHFTLFLYSSRQDCPVLPACSLFHSVLIMLLPSVHRCPHVLALLHHKPEPDVWKHLQFCGLESFRLATLHFISFLMWEEGVRETGQKWITNGRETIGSPIQTSTTHCRT